MEWPLCAMVLGLILMCLSWFFFDGRVGSHASYNYGVMGYSLFFAGTILAAVRCFCGVDISWMTMLLTTLGVMVTSFLVFGLFRRFYKPRPQEDVP